RAKVGSLGCVALSFGHSRTQVLLIAIRREQRTNERRRFVGNLAERIACQIGTRIFARAALCRSRPAAQINTVDSHPLHRDSLPGRVRAKGRDAPALGEEFTQAIVKRRGRLARNRVVVRDRAALLDYLPRGVESNDSVEPRAVEPLLCLGDALLE